MLAIIRYLRLAYQPILAQLEKSPDLKAQILQLRSLQILGYFPGKRTKVEALVGTSFGLVSSDHVQLNPTISADEAWLGEVLYSFFEKMQVLIF